MFPLLCVLIEALALARLAWHMLANGPQHALLLPLQANGDQTHCGVGLRSLQHASELRTAGGELLSKRCPRSDCAGVRMCKKASL